MAVFIGKASSSGGGSGFTAVNAKYYQSANVAPAINAQINYDTKIYDTHNAVTTGVGAWKFTAPFTGIYSIQTTITNASGAANIFVYKNGSSDTKIGIYIAGNAPYCSGTSMSLTAGDFMDIRTDNNAVINGGTAPTITSVSINRVG